MRFLTRKYLIASALGLGSAGSLAMGLAMTSTPAHAYPLLHDPAPAFAKGYFVSASAPRIDTPLLIQASDREYQAGLYAVTALREASQPVDLYVYPDEYHLKWQPAHRIATYRRSLQWFDFWLSDREDPDPIDPGQYARWSAWKAQRRVPADRAVIMTPATSGAPRLRHRRVPAGAGNDPRRGAPDRAAQARSPRDPARRGAPVHRPADARTTASDRAR